MPGKKQCLKRTSRRELLSRLARPHPDIETRMEEKEKQHEPAKLPAYIVKMRAKPETGDKLFELATDGIVKCGASDRFIMLREDGHPAVLSKI